MTHPTREPAVIAPRVRDNHYIFSHFALRQFASKDPVSFFSLMPTERAAGAMLDLWCNVNRDCGNPDSADLVFSEIYWHPVAINDYPCVVVQMPAPQAETEVWFAAVLMMENMHDDSVMADTPRLRYITLEHGGIQDDANATVLCEWTEKGYFNHGAGPEPNLHSFVRYLEVFVQYTR